MKKARGPLALQVLVDAYANTFAGRADELQASIVLADLGNFSGFFEVTGPLDRDNLAYREGMRAVYARIWNYLKVTEEERHHIEMMVRLERQADDLTAGDANYVG